MDLEQAPSNALEQLVAGTSGVSDTVTAWLKSLHAEAGNYPALQTWGMYALYRRWCEESGHVAVEPYPFTRLLMAKFRKKHCRWGDKTTRFWCTDKFTALALRREFTTRPPAPEESQAFSFNRLRRGLKDTR